MAPLITPYWEYFDATELRHDLAREQSKMKHDLNLLRGLTGKLSSGGMFSIATIAGLPPALAAIASMHNSIIMQTFANSWGANSAGFQNMFVNTLLGQGANPNQIDPIVAQHMNAAYHQHFKEIQRQQTEALKEKINDEGEKMEIRLAEIEMDITREEGREKSSKERAKHAIQEMAQV